MALNITFADFDTVCYSNQHNIMQLINGAVNISLSLVDIDIQLGQMSGDIADAGQEGHDAYLLAVNLNKRVSALEARYKELEERVTALEEKVG